MVSRNAHDAIAFEPKLMQFLRVSSTESSDLLSSQLIFRELVNHVVTHACGAIYVGFAWQADGSARLTVEDLGPGEARREARGQARPGRGRGTSPFARMRPELRLRRPTLLGTIAEANLPLTRSGSSTSLQAAESSQASVPFAIFRRMELGRWIERHAGVLGGEARGDLTAEGVPLPPHDAAGPGRSEVQMVSDIGRAIYFNTVPLWLSDLRWICQVTAARGIPAQRLKKEWQALFRVISIRLPFADTGILAQMRDAVTHSFASLADERIVNEGTPAAAFLASFGTQEGPLAEYARLRAQGLAEEEIFCDVLTPAQLESGRQWQLGRMSVAEEHRRTAVVRELIARAREGARTPAQSGFCVVAACAPHERHDVGLEMVTTLLRSRGVRVEYLGAAVLPEEILLAAMLYEARAVLLSATMSSSVYELIGLVDLLKQDERTAHIPVALGGRPFGEIPELYATVGGDVTLRDARQAVHFCERLRERAEPLSDSA
ncbi:MAG: B12-binding domain-containing protein [Vulcanimicrobiaceae bacterium]